jgi:hypothetical protein
MIEAFNTKFVHLIPPQAIIDNAYFAGSHQHGSINNDVDTAGWNYAAIYFYIGATDIALAELSLYDSPDDSTYTIISASNYATSPATLPSATDDNKAVVWFVDLRKYDRYIRINAKGGNGTVGGYGAGWALLSRGDESGGAVANQGVSQRIIL